MQNAAFDNLSAVSKSTLPTSGSTKKSNSSTADAFDQVLRRAGDSTSTKSQLNHEGNATQSKSDSGDEPRERPEAAQPKPKVKATESNDRVTKKSESKRTNNAQETRTSKSSAKKQNSSSTRPGETNSTQDKQDEIEELDDSPVDDESELQAANPELASVVTRISTTDETANAAEASSDTQANSESGQVSTNGESTETNVVTPTSPKLPTVDPTTTVTVAAATEQADQLAAVDVPVTSASVEIVQPVVASDDKTPRAVSKPSVAKASIQVSQANPAAPDETTAKVVSSPSADESAALNGEPKSEESSDSHSTERTKTKTSADESDPADLQTSVDATYVATVAGVQVSSAIVSAQTPLNTTSDNVDGVEPAKIDDDIKSVSDVKRSATAHSDKQSNGNDAASNAPGQVSANDRVTNRTAGAQSSAEPNTVDPARFIQRVARAFKAANEQGGEVRLRLSPPELGAIKVEVSVRDGVMNARLETETSQARSLLLEHLPALKERLADQQIKIDRFDVDLRQDASSTGGFANPSPNYSDQRSSNGSSQSTRRSFVSGAEQSTPTSISTTNTIDGKINVIV